jgi:DNA repair protein RadA/Sms
VSQTDARLKEAGKLGFARALAPLRGKKGKAKAGKISVEEIADLGGLVAMFREGGGAAIRAVGG